MRTFRRCVECPAQPSLWICAAASGLTFLSAAGLSNAQDACELDKLLASNGSAGDGFGSSMAISAQGDVHLVGTPQPDSSLIGKVYVFRRQGSDWIEEMELLAPDGEFEDEFGASVAISADGDTAAIGSPGGDGLVPDTGSVFIFRFDGATWQYDVTLTSESLQKYDGFGGAVSLSADASTLAVGAPAAAIGGAAFIFRYDQKSGNWLEEAMLTNKKAEGGERFGNAVSLWINTLLVGSPAAPDNGDEAGAAYVFTFDADAQEWAQQAKLLASDGDAQDMFGTAAVLEADVAMVGAVQELNAGIGAVYVFERVGTKWMEVQKLTASDGGILHLFGRSVAMDGNTALIGAIGDSDNGVFAGAAYVFRLDQDGSQWVETEKLLPADGDGGDFFGGSAAIKGEVVGIGAFGDEENGDQSGAAYVFDLSCASPCPWDLDGSGNVGASDLLALLASWGSCKGCPADFDGNGTVGASDLLALLANWGPCP